MSNLRVGIMIGYYILGTVLFVAVLVLVISYICFRMAFYVPRKKVVNSEEFKLPDGEIYKKYENEMIGFIKKVRQLPHEDVEITSFDGLKLRGKYYEYAPNAPIELMFHGYRGNSESDLSGGVLRCFALGRSVLLVDHRASGRSEGKVISFGVNESKDCLKWLDFLNNKFENAKIILSGISMGASTILMASGKDLPKNVIGVIADCGYTSPKEIIKTVIKQMKLPPNLAYPFVKLGAKIYGKFNLEEDSPIEAVKRCKVPIIFFHGNVDDYVPYEMSVKNYNACVSRKKLVTVKGAGHGLAYIVAPDEYLKELNEFFTPLLSDKEE